MEHEIRKVNEPGCGVSSCVRLSLGGDDAALNEHENAR
jgi:hypothetical protein